MTRDDGRPTDDFYETPPQATAALLAVEKFTPKIWEPACGRGAISKELKRLGFDVISTDLYDHGYGEPDHDFLVTDYGVRAGTTSIITNPPFSLALEFAQRGVEFINQTDGKMALLARLQWLESIRRKGFFESSPLSAVWIFSRRLPMMHRPDYDGDPVSSLMAFAWFLWTCGHIGPPRLGWLDWKDHYEVPLDNLPLFQT